MISTEIALAAIEVPEGLQLLGVEVTDQCRV